MKTLCILLCLGFISNVSSARIYPVWTTASVTLSGANCVIMTVGFWEDNDTPNPADDVLLGTDIQIICHGAGLKVLDINDAIGSPPNHEIPLDELGKQLENYEEIMRRQEQQKQPARKEE